MKEKELQELLEDMSLEEKVYQMVQIPGAFYIEGTEDSGTTLEREVPERELYLMGSTLNIFGAEKINAIQKKALELQPHHIPMLFMMDVIHGYRTIFPIPLAEGAMFDPETAKKGAEIAAKEASAAGIHVAFSPMLDLVRDARWGRVMESPGEDPYLNGLVGKAIVEGFQGEGEKTHYKDHVASCLKHFAGYGASTAGRDYTAAEISEHSLREYYLPAYHEAVRAGIEMVMTSFNTLDGKPSSGNQHILREILRDEWGFDGTVISDWNAVKEMVIDGFASSDADAAKKGVEAGVDIEMSSLTYPENLIRLVEEGSVPEKLIDEAVLRILRLKNRLGLFENPYKDADALRESEVMLQADSLKEARKAVPKSLVLLKNEPEESDKTCLLPLRKKTKIAMIGPYAPGHELNSHWAPTGNQDDCVSVEKACAEFAADYDFVFAEGARLLTRENYSRSRSERSIEAIRKNGLRAVPEAGYGQENIEEAGSAVISDAKILKTAVLAAASADTAVLFLGEHYSLSGEAHSRGEITLPENQLRLLRAVYEVNPNVVCVIFAGRPLDLREVCGLSKAIVYAWLPGTMGGPGIMDALTGRVNEFGRLPMSMPYSVSQCPISYNEYRVGRPKGLDDPGMFTSCYSDIPNRPLYPFGYGLSYTEFEYGKPEIRAAEGAGVPAARLDPEDRETVLFTASCVLKNTGSVPGTVIPELYIGDVTSSLVRPMKELRGFRRILLQPGEEAEVRFDITPDMLSFYGAEGTKVLEPGEFVIYIGEDSETENAARIRLG